MGFSLDTNSSRDFFATLREDLETSGSIFPDVAYIQSFINGLYFVTEDSPGSLDHFLGLVLVIKLIERTPNFDYSSSQILKMHLDAISVLTEFPTNAIQYMGLEGIEVFKYAIDELVRSFQNKFTKGQGRLTNLNFYAANGNPWAEIPEKLLKGISTLDVSEFRERTNILRNHILLRKSLLECNLDNVGILGNLLEDKFPAEELEDEKLINILLQDLSQIAKNTVMNITSENETYVMLQLQDFIGYFAELCYQRRNRQQVVQFFTSNYPMADYWLKLINMLLDFDTFSTEPDLTKLDIISHNVDELAFLAKLLGKKDLAKKIIQAYVFLIFRGRSRISFTSCQKICDELVTNLPTGNSTHSRLKEYDFTETEHQEILGSIMDLSMLDSGGSTGATYA